MSVLVKSGGNWRISVLILKTKIINSSNFNIKNKHEVLLRLFKESNQRKSLREIKKSILKT